MPLSKVAQGPCLGLRLYKLQQIAIQPLHMCDEKSMRGAFVDP